MLQMRKAESQLPARMSYEFMERQRMHVLETHASEIMNTIAVLNAHPNDPFQRYVSPDAVQRMTPGSLAKQGFEDLLKKSQKQQEADNDPVMRLLKGTDPVNFRNMDIVKKQLDAESARIAAATKAGQPAPVQRTWFGRLHDWLDGVRPDNAMLPASTKEPEAKPEVFDVEPKFSDSYPGTTVTPEDCKRDPTIPDCEKLPGLGLDPTGSTDNTANLPPGDDPNVPVMTRRKPGPTSIYSRSSSAQSREASPAPNAGPTQAPLCPPDNPNIVIRFGRGTGWFGARTDCTNP
jgi:hypothetical protein